MTISPISSIATPSLAVSTGKTATAATSQIAAKPSAPRSAPASSATSSTPATQPASSSKPAPSSGGGGGSSSSAAASEETLAATYSTSVGGKEYSASVDKSGNSYTASVAGLPGVSASGSSVDAAEDAIALKIEAYA